MRIAKEDAGGKTSYVYGIMGESGILLEAAGDNGKTVKYVYGAGALISQESSDGTGYYHYDLRGSTVALTDETGTITDRYQYDVYGQVSHTEGDSTTPFLYNGRDGVMTDGNGLLYMRARYYSPELKRFINADVLQGKIGDSDTLNRYAYVEGNPVSMVDPFGLCAEPGSKKKGSKGFLGKIKSTWHTGVRKVKSGYHTVVSGTKKFFSSWSVSDYIHTALDGLGMIPGGEAVFDGINAIYYLTEGDVMNAGMSGIALIPLVGEAAAGGKFATKTADGVGDVIKSSEKIGDAMQDTVKYVDDIADSGKYADDIAGSGKYVDEIIDGGSGDVIKSGSKAAGNIAKNLDTNNIPNMTKKEIIDAIPDNWKYTEHNGFVHIKDEAGKIRIRIDPPDKVTQYPHVHVYDNDGNLLDSLGNIVDRKSPDGHIPYKN